MNRDTKRIITDTLQVLMETIVDSGEKRVFVIFGVQGQDDQVNTLKGLGFKKNIVSEKDKTFQRCIDIAVKELRRVLSEVYRGSPEFKAKPLPTEES